MLLMGKPFFNREQLSSFNGDCPLICITKKKTAMHLHHSRIIKFNLPFEGSLDLNKDHNRRHGHHRNPLACLQPMRHLSARELLR